MNIDTYALQVRPDRLRLYIARHKGKNKYHKSCYIKFGYATESVEIQTMYPWFEKMLDHYLYKFLRVENVEEAEKELQQIYGQKVGAKLNETAARLICGTYHLLQIRRVAVSSSIISLTNSQPTRHHVTSTAISLLTKLTIHSTP